MSFLQQTLAWERGPRFRIALVNAGLQTPFEALFCKSALLLEFLNYNDSFYCSELAEVITRLVVSGYKLYR